MIDHSHQPRTAAQIAAEERRSSAAWLAAHDFTRWWPELRADLQSVAAGRAPLLSLDGHAPHFELVECYRRQLDALVAAAVAYRAGALLDEQLAAAIAWTAIARTWPCPPIPMVEAAKAANGGAP